jgi:hypothetical protein
MSARGTVRQVAAKTGMLLGALFVFTLLLAALPAHRAPQQGSPQDAATQSPDADCGTVAGIDMGNEHADENAAVGDMTLGHHDAHGVGMTMTAMRTQSPKDVQRTTEMNACR